MKTFDKKAFGERIQAARKKAGYTGAKLAEKMGFHDVTVRYWEIGRNTPTIQTLCQLAEILGVSVGWLAAGEGDMIPNKEG